MSQEERWGGDAPAARAAPPAPPAPSAAVANHPLSAAEAKYLRIYETYPALPPSLVKSGRVYVVAVQLCIGGDGRVVAVALEESANAELDAAVLAALRTWRYRPLVLAGAPSPFCHRMRIHYEVQ